MATKKKQKLDEGMVMISSLLPVGGLIGMPPKRKDNFVFKGLPGQFDKDGNKTLDEYGDPLKEETDFIAFYAGKKTPIKGTDLWDAKKKAIALLKIPKSKQGLLAIKSKKSMDAGDFRYEGKVNEVSSKNVKEVVGLLKDILSEFGHKSQVLLSMDRIQEMYNLLK